MNQPDLSNLFRQIILANEHDGNTARHYKFSDPDGLLTGKSGWSFGLCQFDIANNPRAIDCLRECCFTTDEIHGLKAQSIQAMRSMDNRLLANCTIIDRYDTNQLAECLQWPTRLCKNSAIALASGTILALADYHNQFYMSRNGKMHNFLTTFKRPVTVDDIYQFKLHLPWGLKRRDDVIRRNDNLVRIIKEAA